MAVSESLKKFRESGYSSTKAQPEEKEEVAGPRIFKLTDDEVKELKGYQKGDGTEQECLVTGRLGDDGEFTVTSVRSPSGEQGPGDEGDMAKQVMGMMGQAPVMQPQTMPSPS